MKKKIIAAVLALTMVAGLVTGCATSGSKDLNDTKQSSESSDGTVTLKLLNKYPEDNYRVYFEEAIKEFEAQHENIKVEMENVSDEAIKDKLSVMASGGEMPDIFFSWSGEYVKKFARGGMALDLTSYLEADSEWKEGFLPAFLNNSTFDGETYGVPYRSGIMYMMYNKAVFEENNLTIPETWDDFLNTCNTLKENGMTPIAFGNSSPWYAAWWIGQLNAMMVPADTTAKDYNPETGEFTDPAYVEAVQAFLNLNNNGYFGNNVNSKDYYQVREEFCAGKAGMMLDATPQFSQFTDTMGSEDAWGFFKIPTMEGAKGDPGVVGGGAEVYCISSDCKYPDEAVEFIKFMTTKEQGIKQTKEAGLPNALIGGITEENSSPALAEAYKEAEIYTNIADWLDTAVEASVADQYMTSLQEGLDGKSGEDIMKDVQAAAKEMKDSMSK